MTMELHIYPAVPETLRDSYTALLTACGLTDEGDGDCTALALENSDRIIACGTRKGDLLKQVAVAPDHQGEDLAARILSLLIAQKPAGNLMFCTKPGNRRLFGSMGFYPIVETEDVLLMEQQKHGLDRFLAGLPRFPGPCGAVVCNCDPFTLGHRHLITYAAARCAHLYVFVVSEENGLVPAEDRLELVRRGTADLPDVTVTGGGAYLVSRATFPTYFVKDRGRVEEVRVDLDLTLFGRRIAPALGIVRRFVGQEPYCPITAAYNARMEALLPGMGVTVDEIPRLAGISAGTIRQLAAQHQWDQLRPMVPPMTYDWLYAHASG